MELVILYVEAGVEGSIGENVVVGFLQFCCRVGHPHQPVDTTDGGVKVVLVAQHMWLCQSGLLGRGMVGQLE